eukprot:748063-Hanusia_phi.AAC.1
MGRRSSSKVVVRATGRAMNGQTAWEDENRPRKTLGLLRADPVISKEELDALISAWDEMKSFRLHLRYNHRLK